MPSTTTDVGNATQAQGIRITQRYPAAVRHARAIETAFYLVQQYNNTLYISP